MASVCPPPAAASRAVRAAVARAAQPPSLAAEALSVALPPPRAALSATAHRCAE